MLRFNNSSSWEHINVSLITFALLCMEWCWILDLYENPVLSVK